MANTGERKLSSLASCFHITNEDMPHEKKDAHVRDLAFTEVCVQMQNGK